jgi:O-antigen chain-terminating methyltransferase
VSKTGFYAAFEDKHRGSRELIQSRQRVYLPFVRGVAGLHGTASVVDVGCGRGEWLELLRDEGVDAQGVDLDAGMLEAARALGLDVHQGDAITFLQQLPADSQGIVTGFHIAEHLPFDTLQLLVAEALRVLRPGGLLILETPNPENLAVGTAGFYMDPTHERPLPAPLLAFVPEFHGFCRVKVLRLQHGADLHEEQTRVSLVDVLAGVSPDYAVIAQKPLGAAAAGDQSLLDAAFAEEHGVGLTDLALRHEQQWAARVHTVHEEAARAQHTAFAAQQALDQVSSLLHRMVDQLAALERTTVAQASAVEARVAALDETVRHQVGTVESRVIVLDETVRHQVGALNEKVAGQIASLQHELWASRRELGAVYQSTSWRMTAPWRWVGRQVLAVRSQGPRQRIGGLARKVLAATARASVRMLDRHPRARRMTIGTVRAVGLGGFADRMWTRLSTAAAGTAETAPPEAAAMTPAARRIHEALRRAVTAPPPAAGTRPMHHVRTAKNSANRP